MALRHGLPAFYPGPSEVCDAALTRQNATIRGVIADAGCRAAIRREVRAKLQAVEAAQGD